MMEKNVPKASWEKAISHDIEDNTPRSESRRVEQSESKRLSSLQESCVNIQVLLGIEIGEILAKIKACSVCPTSISGKI